MLRETALGGARLWALVKGFPELLESFHRPTFSYTLSVVALYWLGWGAVSMSLVLSYHILMHKYWIDSAVNSSISFGIVGSRMHADPQSFHFLSVVRSRF